MSYGHLAMDVRKGLPSGCRLNPATPSVDAGRSKGASIFSAPVFTSIVSRLGFATGRREWHSLPVGDDGRFNVRRAFRIPVPLRLFLSGEARLSMPLV